MSNDYFTAVVPIHLHGLEDRIPGAIRVDVVDKSVLLSFEDEAFVDAIEQMANSSTLKGLTLGWIQVVPKEES